MRDIIREYQEAMDKLPIRASFEEETIHFLEKTSKGKRNYKRIGLEQWGRIAAIFAALLFLGTGTMVTAMELGLPGLLRELFQDETSAAKLEMEQYQKLDTCIVSGDKTLQSYGIVGDEETSLLLLEFTLPKAAIPKQYELTALYIRTYGETKEDAVVLNPRCSAVKFGDEQEENRYMLQYEIPWEWANDSRTKGKEIYVEVYGMVFADKQTEEIHYFTGMVLPLTLNTEFADAAKELQVEERIQFEERDVTLEAIRLSQYETCLYLHFPAEQFEDAMTFWKSVTREQMYANGKLISNPNRIMLYHNGKSVEYSEENRNYCPVNLEGENYFSGQGEYWSVLILKAIDFQEGDTLEIRLGDAAVPIRVKKN